MHRTIYLFVYKAALAQLNGRSLDWKMQIAAVWMVGFLKKIIRDRLSAQVSILPQISLMGLSLRL